MNAILADLSTAACLEWALVWSVMTAGCYAAYTDSRYLRIPNKLVIGLLTIGLAGRVGAVQLGLTTWAEVGTIVGLSLGCAVFLYLQGLWAPGDAKLFWAMVVALPPSLFPARDVLSFDYPTWAFLINALVLNMVLTAGALVVFGRGRRETEGGRMGPVAMVLTVLEMAGLAGWTLQVGSLILGRAVLFVEIVVAVVVLRIVLGRFVPDEPRRLVAVPGVIVGGYTTYAGGVPEVYATAVAVTGVMWLAYEAIRQLVGGGIVRTCSLDGLAAGMSPLQGLSLRAGQEAEILTYEESGQLPPDVTVLTEPGRPLRDGQVARLKRLLGGGAVPAGRPDVDVKLSMPFAPALLLAAVITVLTAGDIVRPGVSTLLGWLGEM